MPVVADLDIAKTSGVFEHMLPKERCLVDKGYIDHEYQHTLIFPFKGGQLTKDQKLFNRALSSVRITVERSNRLFKNYHVLRDAFRGHNIALHHIIVEAIGKLVNVRIGVLPLVRRIHPILRGRKVTFDLHKESLMEHH